MAKRARRRSSRRRDVIVEKLKYTFRDHLRILDLFRLCLFRSPYSLSFFLSLAFSHPLPLSARLLFFLIYALLRARGAPARHRLGRRVSNSRQGAERNGKQRARFSEIMYAASVENLERLCTRAAFLFSPLLIPSHPFSRRSVTSSDPTPPVQFGA